MDLVQVFLKKIFWFILLIDGISVFFVIGKFCLANLFKLHLQKFTIGFGKSILYNKKIGKVLFVITSFPIGCKAEFLKSDSLFRRIEPISFIKKVALICAGPISSIFCAFILLFLTFFIFGDTPSTMQLTNTIAGMPAEKSGFQRGDIILKINNKDIKRFDEGRTLIGQLANQKILFNVERKVNYKLFTDYKKAKNYLKTIYKHKDYIKISQKDGDDLMFYAKAPAIKQLKSMNPNNIKVYFSQSTEILNIEVKSTIDSRVGIGIKPYSLDKKSLYLGFSKSLFMAFDFTYILSREFLGQSFTTIYSFLEKRELPLNMPWEIKQFIEEFSDMKIMDFLRLFSMVALTVGWLSFFPIPKLAGGLILVMCTRLTINKLAIYFKFSKEDIIKEKYETWIELIYLASFIFLILLMIFQNMLVVAQL